MSVSRTDPISLEEHVARALCRADNMDPNHLCHCDEEPRWTRYYCDQTAWLCWLDDARAAIAAVREHEARAAESVGELKYTGAATVLSVPAAELMATKAADAMRDRCEAIADEEVDRCTREGRSELPAFRIRDAIATLANSRDKARSES